MSHIAVCVVCLRSELTLFFYVKKCRLVKQYNFTNLKFGTEIISVIIMNKNSKIKLAVFNKFVPEILNIVDIRLFF